MDRDQSWDALFNKWIIKLLFSLHWSYYLDDTTQVEFVAILLPNNVISWQLACHLDWNGKAFVKTFKVWSTMLELENEDVQLE